MPQLLHSGDPSTAAGLGVAILVSKAAQIDRVANAGARMVHTTATALALTQALHAGRILMIDTNSTLANDFALPPAIGSGDRYELVNNKAQTQGSIVIHSNSTADVFKGKAKAFDTTAAADAMVFLSTATDRFAKYNRTTTGGLGYDKLVAYDDAAGVWFVDVEFTGSGSLATPFSAS